AQVLDQLLALAVRQRVHRINDDGPGSRRRIMLLGAQDGIDDGEEKAERLAGAGTGGDDEALALPRKGNGLFLVTIEPDREVLGSDRAQFTSRRHIPRGP